MFNLQDPKHLALAAGATGALWYFFVREDDEAEAEDFGGLALTNADLSLMNPKKKRRRRKKKKKKSSSSSGGFWSKLVPGKKTRSKTRSRTKARAKKINKKRGTKWWQLAEKAQNRRTAKTQVREEQFYTTPLRTPFPYDNSEAGIQALRDLFYRVKAMKPGPKPRSKSNAKYSGWVVAYTTWKQDMELIRDTYRAMKSAQGSASGTLQRAASQYSGIALSNRW